MPKTPKTPRNRSSEPAAEALATRAELAPDIRLYGRVAPEMLASCLQQVAMLRRTQKRVVLELSTEGGDADVARRIADELWQLQAEGRAVYVVGRSYVYSAGITILAAVPPARRYLGRDTQLLIHERRLQKDIRLDGPLSVCAVLLRNALQEVETGQRLEREGLQALVAGTPMDLEALEAKVFDQDWYLTAEIACRSGLVAALV